MLVKDLEGILFDCENVTIAVFNDGIEMGRDSEITFEYAARIYHDYEVWHMFTIAGLLIIYVREPSVEKNLSPELQGIIECYEEFSEFIDDCGMRALL